MNRRDVFKLGIAAATGSAAVAQHPNAVASAAAAGVSQAGWKSVLFDAHQNDTVAVLCELVIPATDTPGAKEALVNRYLDRILNDGPAGDRESFLEGLAWLDGFAIRRHNQPFVRCSEAQQVAILGILEEGQGEEIAPGAMFFQQAKSWIARIYYKTEIGYRELNKGDRVPSSFACAEGNA